MVGCDELQGVFTGFVSAALEPVGEGLGLPRGWSTDFIWEAEG